MLLHPAASCRGGLIASPRLPGVLHGCRDWMQTASDSWKREVASSEAPTSRAAGGHCVCSPGRALLASFWGPSMFGQCPTISSSEPGAELGFPIPNQPPVSASQGSCLAPVPTGFYWAGPRFANTAVARCAPAAGACRQHPWLEGGRERARIHPF